MNVALPKIQHDYAGFEALIGLHAQTREYFFDDVCVDLSNVGWFDADMCAPFGAILYGLGENVNAVQLENLRPGVAAILSKNGFLSHYGRAPVPDRWGTTIQYQRFDVQDDRFFAAYVEEKLVQRAKIPTMSSGLSKKFRESIFEIFSNAVLHSRTEMGIFSCGQYFPKRNRLDFSVADLGIGIRRNVIESTGRAMAPEAAIAWATEGRNTTKKGQIPGGLGLKLLSEFIDLNGGCLQIVSDSGYWKRESGKTSTRRFSHSFPGTVVTVEINTADTQSYVLASELSEEDIF